MKNSKVMFRFFTIMQWKQEQAFLAAQHKNGWKFTKLNFPGFYHFEKCDAEDVVYQLDFNQEGLAHKEEYVQMFRDCGWEYLQDYVGYAYFRKPASQMNGDGDEEIFCDDASRLEFMKRVFRGRITPLIIIFCAVILPQIYITAHNSDPLAWLLRGMFIVLAVIYIALFLAFAVQYYKCKK